MRLVENHTFELQNRVWARFQEWLSKNLSLEARHQLCLCPEIAVMVLERYGLHLFATGGKLYELRHILVLVQQEYPRIRIATYWTLLATSDTMGAASACET